MLNYTHILLNLVAGGGAGGNPIRVRDVDDDHLNGQGLRGVWGVSAQNHKANYGETAKMTGGWELGVTNAVD